MPQLGPQLVPPQVQIPYLSGGKQPWQQQLQLWPLRQRWQYRHIVAAVDRIFHTAASQTPSLISCWFTARTASKLWLRQDKLQGQLQQCMSAAASRAPFLTSMLQQQLVAVPNWRHSTCASSFETPVAAVLSWCSCGEPMQLC